MRGKCGFAPVTAGSSGPLTLIPLGRALLLFGGGLARATNPCPARVSIVRMPPSLPADGGGGAELVWATFTEVPGLGAVGPVGPPAADSAPRGDSPEAPNTKYQLE